MSDASGYAAREAVDDDLVKLGEMLEVQSRIPVIPAFLRQPELADSGAPHAAGTGRKSDALRAGWGAHVQSSEDAPGGVNL